MRWRITTLLFLFVACYAFLAFNIYDLQFHKGEYYITRAESRAKLAKAEGPIRGNIYFSDRESKALVALNKEEVVVYAVPTEIQENGGDEMIRQYARVLSPLIKKEEVQIGRLLSKQNDQYEILVEKIDQRIVEQIDQLQLKGIYAEKKLFRFYPFDALAAQIIGFVAGGEKNELVGKYGIELQFNKKLEGTEKKTGDEITLTIDRTVQSYAEELLERVVTEHKAQGGTIIVEEANSGKIVALTNYPNFNPNSYSQFELKTFINPAVQMVYEPGSVMKPITMAAGIESKKITPETTFVDAGSITLNKKKIENWDGKANGKQTMRSVLELSINTGAVFAEQKTGHDIFYNYLTKFGFAEQTGIALPGEVRGNISNLKNGKEIDFATASFGQGIAVTPIEMINAFAAFANGGKLMQPIIVEGEKSKVIRQAINQKTAETITDMLVGVVKRNKVADITKYTVAGKTGTAYIPNFVKGGYTEDVVNNFVGFAPAQAKSGPKYVVLIKIDKPAGSPVAAVTVGPAFRDLMQFVLNYYNIPPDAL